MDILNFLYLLCSIMFFVNFLSREKEKGGGERETDSHVQTDRQKTERQRQKKRQRDRQKETEERYSYWYYIVCTMCVPFFKPKSAMYLFSTSTDILQLLYLILCKPSDERKRERERVVTGIMCIQLKMWFNLYYCFQLQLLHVKIQSKENGHTYMIDTAWST